MGCRHATERDMWDLYQITGVDGKVFADISLIECDDKLQKA
jgi:hypothetical protein